MTRPRAPGETRIVYAEGGRPGDRHPLAQSRGPLAQFDHDPHEVPPALTSALVSAEQAAQLAAEAHSTARTALHRATTERRAIESRAFDQSRRGLVVSAANVDLPRLERATRESERLALIEADAARVLADALSNLTAARARYRNSHTQETL